MYGKSVGKKNHCVYLEYIKCYISLSKLKDSKSYFNLLILFLSTPTVHHMSFSMILQELSLLSERKKKKEMIELFAGI